MTSIVTASKVHQRSYGSAAVTFDNDNLVKLYQRGAAKALLPRTYGSMNEVVLINTAGGITGGDSYQYFCEAAASPLVVTTQAAERAYQSSTRDIASIDVHLTATNGAKLHWLPQETILFNQCRIARRIKVDLDSSSECLVLEPLVFGRHAMGEQLKKCHFTDRWRIRRNGELVHAEALSLTDDVATLLAAPAGGAGAQMAATLVYVGPRLEQIEADIKTALPSLTSRVATSVWQDRLVLRLLAAQTMSGKTDLHHILKFLRGQHLPRVWHT